MNKIIIAILFSFTILFTTNICAEEIIEENEVEEVTLFTVEYQIQTMEEGIDEFGFDYDNKYITTTKEFTASIGEIITIDNPNIQLLNSEGLIVDEANSTTELFVEEDIETRFVIRYIRDKYNVIYNEFCDNEVDDIIDIKFGAEITISDGPIIENNEFLYWEDQNGEIYHPGYIMSVPVDGLTLNAVYEYNENYLVNYHIPTLKGDFDVETISNEGKIGESILLSDIDTLDMDGFTPVINIEEELEVAILHHDAELSLDLYYSREQFILTFIDYYQSIPISLYYEEIYIIPNFEKNDHQLEYLYYFNEEEQVKFYPDENGEITFYMPAQDVTLFARWVKNNIVEVIPTTTPEIYVNNNYEPVVTKAPSTPLPTLNTKIEELEYEESIVEDEEVIVDDFTPTVGTSHHVDISVFNIIVTFIVGLLCVILLSLNYSKTASYFVFLIFIFMFTYLVYTFDFNFEVTVFNTYSLIFLIMTFVVLIVVLVTISNNLYRRLNLEDKVNYNYGRSKWILLN